MGWKKELCCLLILQPAHFINVNAVDVTVDHGNNGEPDGDLGCGNGHDEKYEDLPGRILVISGEGHQQQVDGIQHQFHRHENDDGVAPNQNADDANYKQHGSEIHEMFYRYSLEDFRHLKFFSKFFNFLVADRTC